MKQQIKILLFSVFGILLINSCSLLKTGTCVGKTGSFEYENVLIKTNKYDGVIFSKDYIGMLNQSDNKFTPTISDIDSAEFILRKEIKEINVNRPNQVKNCPVIHRKLRKYKRQYFGYFDKNGDKIIFINCFWEKKGFYGFIDDFFYKEPNNNNWRIEEKIVLDGCSYYWSIKVNLTQKTLFDFGVNGIA